MSADKTIGESQLPTYPTTFGKQPIVLTEEDIRAMMAVIEQLFKNKQQQKDKAP